MTKKSLTAIMALIFSMSCTANAKVSLTEQTGAYGKEITLSNGILSATFVPEWGGRMKHLVDISSQTDLIFWDYPPDHPKWGYGWGGALDDRNGWDVGYGLEIVEKGAKKTTIKLSSPQFNSGLRIEKSITLREGSHKLDIEYRYQNHGQKEMTGYALAIRNFFRPSGKAPDWNIERAFIPTVKAIREIGNLPVYPELQSKFYTEVIPTWNGFIDTDKGLGLAFSFEDDFYRWFYRWIKDESATWEWTFGSLAPGKEAVTHFSIGLTKGLKGYTDITNSYASQMILSGKDSPTATFRIFPTEKSFSHLTVKSILLSLERKVITSLPDISIENATVGALSEATTSWNIPLSEGIIIQKIYEGNNLLGEYELPYPLHAPATAYHRPKTARSNATTNTIAGWEKEEKQVSLTITDKDRARGYMVYTDYFSRNQNERGKDISTFTMDLGQGERESFALKVKSLGETGPFSLSSPDTRILIRFENEDPLLEQKKVGKEGLIGRRLDSFTPFTLQKEEEATIWITWDGSSTKPGTIHIPLLLSAGLNKIKQLNLTIHIHNITLPERNLFQFEVEGDLFQIFAKKYGWELETIMPYIKDLGTHRVNIAHIFSGMEQTLPTDKIKLRNTGETLKEALAKNPKIFSEKPLLDFSWFDPWFDAMIDAGLVRAYTRQSGLKERTPEDMWRLKELARYLSERGYPYRDRYVKFVDEQPPETFPAMARTGEMYHSLGWRVLHTSSPMQSSAQMKILNPSTDLWHGAIPKKHFVQARLSEGTLDPDDEIWTYDGWGAVWESYESRRGFAWFCASHDLNGLHLHVYYRSSLLDALIFPTPEGPVASAAWEGANDGIEDVQYFLLARNILKKIKSSGVWNSALAKMETTLNQRAEKMAMRNELNREYKNLLEAKLESIKILSQLKSYKKNIKPSILYGFENIVSNGKILYTIAGDPKAGDVLKKKIASSGGISISFSKNISLAANQKKIILGELTDPLFQQFVRKFKLPVSATVPSENGYAIWEILPDTAQNFSAIVIAGRDKKGLAQGTNNFFRMLRIEPFTGF
ncbi:MAG: hypothetical protein WDA18_05620 [Candidatus Ratteibacteria bacterium]|jgi:hypothetical protein